MCAPTEWLVVSLYNYNEILGSRNRSERRVKREWALKLSLS